MEQNKGEEEEQNRAKDGVSERCVYVCGFIQTCGASSVCLFGWLVGYRSHRHRDCYVHIIFSCFAMRRCRYRQIPLPSPFLFPFFPSSLLPFLLPFFLSFFLSFFPSSLPSSLCSRESHVPFSQHAEPHAASQDPESRFHKRVKRVGQRPQRRVARA